MNTNPSRVPLLSLAILAALLAPAAAQTGPGGRPMGGPQGGLPQGVSREQMWPAPTAEDWKKPCLVQWQRNYEDALAVAEQTGKAILVCINMDGEIASEHYAGIRYRQPEITELYKPYVCVIASVYRHNPRDFDEKGERILCPRFGGVTCGEHIAIEPGLFDKFMEGKRIAPRHIGVELEKQGAEMYDVYYAWDTDTIFTALKEGTASRPPLPPEPSKSDRPLLERVTSRDNEDQTAVEQAYLRGDAAQRRALLESALASGSAVSVGLLRLAVRGLDLDLAQTARRALSQSASPEAVELISEALRVPMEKTEREALIAALERLGESAPRARTLVAVYRGLDGSSSTIDVESWTAALSSAAAPTSQPERGELQARLEQRDDARDAQARLEYAESFLALAADQKSDPKLARVMYDDARAAALDAEKLGAKGWRVDAAIALSASKVGDYSVAHTRAEAALKSMPADAATPTSVAVLELLARARHQAIVKALREKTAWPAQWLSDLHAAYAVLARHPLGQDHHVISHYDFLKYLGAATQASRVLDDGLVRFPDSWVLHDRQRGRLLEERGPDGLEAAYESMLREQIAQPNLEWFAGYASLTAAEFHRRANTVEPAVAAYDRAIAHYERGIELTPTSRESSDHYVALALAGKARIAFERGELDTATELILASFARRPEAAANLDGLNLSPVDTAKQLRSKLAEAQRDELVTKLQAALDSLDPALLELPAYERATPGGPSPDAQRFGRRR